MADPALDIIHVIASGGYGGAESVVRMLADGLARRGHRVHVALSLAETGEHPLETQLRSSPLEVTAWRLPPRAYKRERELIAGLCDRLAPDVVHTHGYRADVVASKAMRGRPTPLVSTAHGFTRGDPKNRLYEWLQRRAYRRFDAVVAVSRSVADRLLSAGVSADRVHLVPNAWIPAGEPMSRSSARRALGLPAEGPVVGWVGRLSKEKGADVLVDAIARLPGGPAAFAVLGDGPERSALESRAASRGVDERIRWLGGVAGAGRYFPAFDLFVLSSRTEGTPIVLFEAMGAGVPIVATSVGGVPDVVSDREAILVTPDDPTALAGAIQRALADFGTEALARAARAKLESAYDPQTWLESHEDLYHAIRRQRGGGDELR